MPILQEGFILVFVYLATNLRKNPSFLEYPMIIVKKTIQNEEILQIIGIKFANVK